jgi:hypothetical protein
MAQREDKSGRWYDPENVARALAVGEVWRAKETLRGAIGHSPYDPGLYAEYGELLLRLAERAEAGKYLFLAGSDSSDHADAIALYLHRHGRNGWRSLVASWPRRARLAMPRELPPPVLRELFRAGMPEGEADCPLSQPPEGWRQTAAPVTAGLDCMAPLCLITAILLVLGLASLGDLVVRLFR